MEFYMSTEYKTLTYLTGIDLVTNPQTLDLADLAKYLNDGWKMVTQPYPVITIKPDRNKSVLANPGRDKDATLVTMMQVIISKEIKG